jgi:hypothetical protein
MTTDYGLGAGVLFLSGENDFSFLYSVRTGSGAHPASYPVLFPRGKSGWGVMLTTHLHLVPRSRMVELYFHSPYFFMA